MILTFLIFIAPLIMLILACQYLINNSKAELITVSIIALIIILHCQYLTYSLPKESIDDIWFNGHKWMLSMLMPALYVFFAMKSGQKWLNEQFVALLALSLMNFSHGMTFSIGTPAPIDYGVDDHVHIIIGSKFALSTITWEFTVGFQLLWMMTRIIKMVIIMDRNKLHYSLGMKKMAFVAVGLIVVSFVSICIPHNTWISNPLLLWTYHIITSGCLTAGLWIIKNGEMDNTVLDENNQPYVSPLTVDKATLKMKIIKVVETEQVFKRKDLKLNDLAIEIGSNRTYVSNAINELFGANFNSYINSVRVREAKHLIATTPDMPMEEVAEQCGFANASSFSKIFKKECNVSPSVFAKEARGAKKK